MLHTTVGIKALLQQHHDPRAETFNQPKLHAEAFRQNGYLIACLVFASALN